MHVYLALLWFLFLLRGTTAYASQPKSVETGNASLQNCQNVHLGLHPTCWDVLKMDRWMQNWNATTKTCQPDELWANCFMREAGITRIKGLGCAQVGPNTCPAPTRENLASASVKTWYGAYSIWSLQHYMTAIYSNLQTPQGLTTIESTYANLTDPVGKSLFASLLFHEGTPLAKTIGAMVTSNILVPESVIAIPEVSQAPKALGQVLAAYLESFMTNFTLGGFSGCARHGMLVRQQSWVG